jgi:hypothetical protein
MVQRHEPEGVREFAPSYRSSQQPADQGSRQLSPLCGFTPFGLLPPGIHDSTLAEVEERFVWTGRRKELWRNFTNFLDRLRPNNSEFHCVYLDGGFVTQKLEPEDLDAILQPKAAWGTAALEAMSPFFQQGLDEIYKKHKIHLHFWCEGCPGGMSDFRLFFQYVRPQEAAPLGLKDDARKGIVRIIL